MHVDLVILFFLMTLNIRECSEARDEISGKGKENCFIHHESKSSSRVNDDETAPLLNSCTALLSHG